MGWLDLVLRSPVWLVVVALLVGVLTVVLRRERYRPPPTEWTLPTTEVFQDPETGRRLRVYVNPATGERVYHEDPSSPLYPPLERPGVLPPPPEPGLPPAPSPPALPPGHGPTSPAG